jgi:hypothetical protein
MQAKKETRAEVGGLRQGARSPDALAILKKVSRHYRVAIARLRRRGGYGLGARNVAMWLVWEQCGMSLREVGDFFGGLSYAAVAQRLRRLTSADKQDAARLLSKCQKHRCDPQPPFRHRDTDSPGSLLSVKSGQTQSEPATKKEKTSGEAREKVLARTLL